MIQFLEQYVWWGVALCTILALADAWTTREVIKRQKDGTRKGREGNWLPAKMIETFGLTKYLIASRVLVLGAFWLEPMTGWTLSLFFAYAVWNNYQNMR